MAEKREISDGDENLDPNVSKKRLSLSLKKEAAITSGKLLMNNSILCRFT